MTKDTKPLSTMALPQYALSNDFMERFLDAIHTPGKEIVRSPNTKGIKLVDGSELDGDALTYFTENKCALEEEFLADLTEKIGTKKAREFCDVIASNWYDGRAKREAIPVQRLKASIRSYLDCILRGRILLSEIVVMHDPLAVTPSFSDAEVAKILSVNDRLLLKHIDCWLRRARFGSTPGT